MFLVPVTPQEIRDIIKHLKTKNTMDVKYFSTKIIQCGAEYISEPISAVINSCFEQGIVPNKMKIAKVTAIYKKGDTLDCANYRPIAILPVFSKILESALLSRLGVLFEQPSDSDMSPTWISKGS